MEWRRSSLRRKRRRPPALAPGRAPGHAPGQSLSRSHSFLWTIFTQCLHITVTLKAWPYFLRCTSTEVCWSCACGSVDATIEVSRQPGFHACVFPAPSSMPVDDRCMRKSMNGPLGATSSSGFMLFVETCSPSLSSLSPIRIQSFDYIRISSCLCHRKPL